MRNEGGSLPQLEQGVITQKGHFRMTRHQFSTLVNMYVGQILKSTDMETDFATRMFHSGKADAVMCTMIDCFIENFEEFRQEAKTKLGEYGFSLYGIDLAILEGASK